MIFILVKIDKKEEQKKTMAKEQELEVSEKVSLKFFRGLINDVFGYRLVMIFILHENIYHLVVFENKRPDFIAYDCERNHPFLM